MDLIPGAAARVLLGFHEASPEIGTHYMYGPTPNDAADHWYDFFFDETTGARIENTSDGTAILLSFVDGQRGDGDLTVNGEISELDAPVSPSGGGSGGGGCFLNAAL